MSLVSDAQSNSDEPHQNVAVKDVRSLVQPDFLRAVMPGRPVNDATTTDIKMANYRLAQFTESMTKLKFDQLRETKFGHDDAVYAAAQRIDGVLFTMHTMKSDIIRSIALREFKSEQEIDALAAQLKIERSEAAVVINGKKYEVTINYPFNFGAGQDRSFVIDTAVVVLGPSALAGSIAAIVAARGLDAFKNAFKEVEGAMFTVVWGLTKGLAKYVYSFASVFISQIMQRVEFGAALSAARAAAGESWSRATQGLTKARLAYAFAGFVFVVAALLIATYVLHTSLHIVYVYNLTDDDLEFSFPYIDYGTLGQLPSTEGLVKGKEKQYAPGQVYIGDSYNATAFSFVSSTQLTGLGYVLKLNLRKRDTTQVTKSMTALFTVPYAGQNSLDATASTIASYSLYYQNNTGLYKQVDKSVVDNQHELIVTYDYLTGQHLNPFTKSEMFVYVSLVIVRDKVAPSRNRSDDEATADVQRRFAEVLEVIQRDIPEGVDGQVYSA